ncbi:MAG: hypothetical protein ACFCUG_12770 [Thiotrichales bacterium]
MNTNRVLNLAAGSILGVSIWLSLVILLTIIGRGEWMQQHCHYCLAILVPLGALIGGAVGALDSRPRPHFNSYLNRV